MPDSPANGPGDPERDPDPAANSTVRMYGLVGVGFEFVCTVGAMTLLGWYLDKKWHTTPWLLVTGVAVGFAAGLWMLIRSAGSSFKD